MLVAYDNAILAFRDASQMLHQILNLARSKMIGHFRNESNVLPYKHSWDHL